jgi:ubiquinone/menaquinone biosynthesis C-methylase UbiE
MMVIAHRGLLPTTGGKVFHWPRTYDLLLRLFWGRSEQGYRNRIVELARLRAGDSVLDVGCGTGTLAIAARRGVGAASSVAGIDPSPEMIARARSKAAEAGVAIDFRVAAAEALPFADASFDAVLNTTVLHCLPQDARGAAIGEMRRVLKRGGRLLIVDFGGPRQERRSLVAKISVHGRFDLGAAVPILDDLGFVGIETGQIALSDLRFVRGTVSGGAA